MKIPTDTETEYMAPMSEDQVSDYAEVIVSHMDDNRIITQDGMDFLTRADNIPCEEDQVAIMAKVEEIYNEKKPSENSDRGQEGSDTQGAEAGLVNSDGDQGQEVPSQEEAGSCPADSSEANPSTES